jgi:hypothetical protein
MLKEATHEHEHELNVLHMHHHVEQHHDEDNQTKQAASPERLSPEDPGEYEALRSDSEPLELFKRRSLRLPDRGQEQVTANALFQQRREEIRATVAALPGQQPGPGKAKIHEGII